MEPGSAEHRPPRSQLEDRIAAARAKRQQRRGAWREDVEASAHDLQAASRCQQREDVQDGRAANNEGNEAQIGAE